VEALRSGTKTAFVSVHRWRGMDSETLRRLARRRLDHGDLPDASPQRIRVNAGEGGQCALCGEPIRRPEPEYELDFELGQWGMLGAPCRLHARCHTIWEQERAARR
jgi:hypothetical protein